MAAYDEMPHKAMRPEHMAAAWTLHTDEVPMLAWNVGALGKDMIFGPFNSPVVVNQRGLVDATQINNGDVDPRGIWLLLWNAPLV